MANRFTKILIILAILILRITTNAQVSDWRWATGPLGPGISSAVCADANGNTYLTGHFLGTLFFNTGAITDTAGGIQNVFIGKFDATGQPVWGTQALGYADANGISVDAAGNFYVVGTFYNDSITIGSQVLFNPHAGAQNSNAFLAKYDTSGNFIWAKNLGGINNNTAAGVATDPTGNIYVTGNFLGDSLSLNGITVQHLGANDGFVAKFDATGDALWITNTGSPFLNGTSAICADASGNVIITGYFEGNTIYTGNTDSTLTSPYAYNVFTIKYDAWGTKKWAKYAGNNYGNGPGSIASDAQGNVYITGYYSDTVALDNNILTGRAQQNSFTAKYDSTGVLLWSQTTNGDYLDQTNGIAADANGNAYITGYFESDTLIVGNQYLLNPTGGQVSFVAKYNPAGHTEFVLSATGASNNSSTAICYNAGSVFAAGYFEGSNIIFGNTTLAQSQYSSFLCRIDTGVITNITGILPTNNTTVGISVFPNPSSNNFNFSGIPSGSKIEIFNLLGQSIFVTNTESNTYTLNLQQKSQGIYIYQVTDNAGRVQQDKIVLE